MRQSHHLLRSELLRGEPLQTVVWKNPGIQGVKKDGLWSEVMARGCEWRWTLAGSQADRVLTVCGPEQLSA